MREMALVAEFERICSRGLDDRSLRAALLEALRPAVSFDAHAWVVTDPVTAVGSSPVAEIPDLTMLPAVIGAKYLTAANRWTILTAGDVVTLAEMTGDRLEQSRRWTEVLSVWDIADVLSTVFVDEHGTWAFLDLWRRGRRFGPQDCDHVRSLISVATPALRRSLVSTFDPVVDRAGSGPAVILLASDLTPVTRTAAADDRLRELLPTDADRSPVPAAALNVAAQLLAVEAGVDEHAPTARAHLRDGSWATVRAARLLDPADDAGTISVSIERATPAERSDLHARVIGLSPRERAVFDRVVAGDSTRDAAGALFVSEHTVQDHLKSIFSKAGVHSRRELLSRATGAG